MRRAYINVGDRVFWTSSANNINHFHASRATEVEILQVDVPVRSTWGTSQNGYLVKDVDGNFKDGEPFTVLGRNLFPRDKVLALREENQTNMLARAEREAMLLRIESTLGISLSSSWGYSSRVLPENYTVSFEDLLALAQCVDAAFDRK